jgi:hypothetical protein
MKLLSKKILESGLVGKHAALMMEKMGLLESGSAEMADKQLLTAKSLERFLEDVEELLAGKEEIDIKETRLEVVVKKQYELLSSKGGPFRAVEDEWGRLVVPPDIKLRSGLRLFLKDGGSFGVVETVEPLYRDEKLAGYEVTLDRDR